MSYRPLTGIVPIDIGPIHGELGFRPLTGIVP